MKFHERLARLCEDKRLTQREIASALKVGVSTVNRWLSGEGDPRLSEAVSLAQLLNVRLAELVGEEVVKPGDELSDDERAVLDVFRALRLKRHEAIRRLARGETSSLSMRKRPRSSDDLTITPEELEYFNKFKPKRSPFIRRVLEGMLDEPDRGSGKVPLHDVIQRLIDEALVESAGEPGTVPSPGPPSGTTIPVEGESEHSPTREPEQQEGKPKRSHEGPEDPKGGPRKDS